MTKYYVANLVGVKDNFYYNRYMGLLCEAIYEADKDDYGEYIFTKTLGGYKEVATGRFFKSISSDSDSYTAPFNRGLMVDGNSATLISSGKEEKILKKYCAKINKTKLEKYFDEIQEKCDSVIPCITNNSGLAYARLLGIREDFDPHLKKELRCSIYKSPKDDYGEFIFKKGKFSYKEILTGLRFKYIEHGHDFDGYPYYMSPKDTGLVVDANSESFITKYYLEDELEKYNKEHNKEELAKYLTELKEKCDSYLFNMDEEETIQKINKRIK